MRIVSHVRRCWQDKSAAVAIEFALILPFMVLLLFGGVDLTQGVSARRKVAMASATMSDLVAQAAQVTTGDMDNVFTAGSAVLTPFDPAKLKTVIASIVVDANGVPKVGWSRAKNRAALSPGSVYTLPPSFPAQYKAPNSSFIVAEVGFTYKPITGSAVIGTLDMADISYALPRVASTKTGVPCKWDGCP